MVDQIDYKDFDKIIKQSVENFIEEVDDINELEEENEGEALVNLKDMKKKGIMKVRKSKRKITDSNSDKNSDDNDINNDNDNDNESHSFDENQLVMSPGISKKIKSRSDTKELSNKDPKESRQSIQARDSYGNAGSTSYENINVKDLGKMS